MPHNRTILTRKRDLIEASRTKLTGIASSIQVIYWREIRKIINQLDFDDTNRIIENERNLKFLDDLQKIYMDLQAEQVLKITDKIQKDFTKMNGLDDQYFSTIVSKDSTSFKQGKNISETLRLQSLGITVSGKLKAEGFLSSLLRDTTPSRALSRTLLSGIIANKTVEALTKEMEVAIIGTDTISGITEKQLNNLVFDAYHQFDRSTSSTRAEKIGLFAAVYENNLIKDSRCFCRNRFNRIWTVDEIKTWKASTNPKKTKEGANCLAIFTSANYDPFIQLGGYNCRHYLRYITSAQAINRRSELKEYFDQLEKDGVDFI